MRITKPDDAGGVLVLAFPETVFVEVFEVLEDDDGRQMPLSMVRTHGVSCYARVSYDYRMFEIRMPTERGDEHYFTACMN